MIGLDFVQMAKLITNKKVLLLTNVVEMEIKLKYEQTVFKMKTYYEKLSVATHSEISN